MKRNLGETMRRIEGHPQAGHWLHITVEDPFTGAVELVELQEHGGRFNPPNSFPVLYCAEDSPGCREAMTRWIESEKDSDAKIVVLHLDVHLGKILDLGSAAMRKRLGVTLAELADPGKMKIGQGLGAAAHDAGFAGIVYPRPMGKGARNLALFCDRTNPKEVSIVGAGTLEA